jgi:hypothetical protein
MHVELVLVVLMNTVITLISQHAFRTTTIYTYSILQCFSMVDASNVITHYTHSPPHIRIGVVLIRNTQ